MLHMKKCFSRIQVLTYDVKVCDNGVPQPPWGPRPLAAVVPSQQVQRERCRAPVAEPQSEPRPLLSLPAPSPVSLLLTR